MIIVSEKRIYFWHHFSSLKEMKEMREEIRKSETEIKRLAESGK